MTVEEWQNINHFFSKKLSNRITFHNIYPYIYEHQPKYILDDIKSFCSGYEEMEKFYKGILTAHQFWQAVYNFLQQEEPPVGWYHNGKSVPDRGVGFAAIVIKRIYSLKNASVETISAYNNNLFFKYGLSLININPDSEELHRLCKKFFALFTPDERMDFMENWIVRNTTPREEYIQMWKAENADEWTEENQAIMDSYPDMADY